MYNLTPYMQMCCILHETANELFLFLMLHQQLTQNAWALEAKRDFADASQLDTLQEDQFYAFEKYSVLICIGNQYFTTSLLICAGWLAVLPYSMNDKSTGPRGRRETWWWPERGGRPSTPQIP